MAPELEANSKGGGQRGGPRRWDGAGPRPARHIPWPELFKHHQSNLTGHLKMMDMVRKHCVPGSGNYQAAQACVDRTHEMLRMFKEATRNFVPPRDGIDKVPLGASSASMYPGYSPADHIYGEASAEYGAMIAEARRQGKEIKSDPDGIEYVVGQSHLSAREQLEEVRKSFAAKKAKNRDETSTQKEQDRENGEPMEDIEQTADASQLFVIDSNPTPISNLQNKSDGPPSKGKNKANDKAKRRGSSHEEQSNTTEEAPETSHKKKKAKVATADEDKIESKPLVEEDDISAEVDQRLKEKEERRRRKMEKKRKRESGSSQVEVVEEINVPAEGVHAEKPEKKKHKKGKNLEEAKEATPPASEERKSKREKRKKRSSTAGEAGEESSRAAAVQSDKPKKKRKKESEEATA